MKGSFFLFPFQRLQGMARSMLLGRRVETKKWQRRKELGSGQ